MAKKAEQAARTSARAIATTLRTFRCRRSAATPDRSRQSSIPDKIILFGSYAYGQPHESSDVDLLVVMPAYDETNQAIRIINALEAPFSLDLIVRTPGNNRT